LSLLIADCRLPIADRGKMTDTKPLLDSGDMTAQKASEAGKRS